MKRLFFILLLTISTVGFAQNNFIVKTEDGRRVLLKADFTWEFIDLEKPKTVNQSNELSNLKMNNNCNTSIGFSEPKLNSKIQSELKRGRASMPYIKKKVAKKYNCKKEDILLLSVSENKQKGVYKFCANGTIVTYKRLGNSISEAIKLF